jgi:hypothetical protein
MAGPPRRTPHTRLLAPTQHDDLARLQDASSFLEEVDREVRAAAPEGSSIARPDSHRWLVELDDEGVLAHDFWVIATTEPFSVIVLHGNHDGGPVPADWRPLQATYFAESYVRAGGLRLQLAEVFAKEPNSWGYS